MNSLHQSFICRSNPHFTYVPYSDLSEIDDNVLLNMISSEEYSGILRSDCELNIKAISEDVAEIFKRFKKPQSSEGIEFNTLQKLVISGILEIKISGKFKSGPVTLPYLGISTPTETLSDSYINEISKKAILMTALLPIEDITKLAARIYFFNRVPYDSNFRPDGREIRRSLINTCRQNNLAKYLIHPVRNGWFQFGIKKDEINTGLTWKLYISPMPKAFRETLEIVLPEINSIVPSAFKFASTSPGIFRPDKIVLYFNSFDKLKESAHFLEKKLEGIPVHGVPFSSQIDANGMLSWGIDPPNMKSIIYQLKSWSWRVWVAHQLAIASTLVRSQKYEEKDLVKLVLHYADYVGINTSNWSPKESLLRSLKNEY